MIIYFGGNFTNFKVLIKSGIDIDINDESESK